MITLLIVFLSVAPAFISARKMRQALGVEFGSCKSGCKSHAWMTSGYKTEYCNCGWRRSDSHITPAKFWLLVASFFLWPLFIVGWFIMTDSLPKIGKSSLAARTAHLRAKNERMNTELDRIERELAAL